MARAFLTLWLRHFLAAPRPRGRGPSSPGTPPATRRRPYLETLEDRLPPGNLLAAGSTPWQLQGWESGSVLSASGSGGLSASSPTGAGTLSLSNTAGNGDLSSGAPAIPAVGGNTPSGDPPAPDPGSPQDPPTTTPGAPTDPTAGSPLPTSVLPPSGGTTADGGGGSTTTSSSAPVFYNPWSKAPPHHGHKPHKPHGHHGGQHGHHGHGHGQPTSGNSPATPPTSPPPAAPPSGGGTTPADPPPSGGAGNSPTSPDGGSGAQSQGISIGPDHTSNNPVITFGVGPVVDITRAQGPQSEISAAVNPLDPNQLFVGSNDLPVLEANLAGMTASSSSDGGKTWESHVIADGVHDSLPLSFSDPAVAWDSFGNLFYSYVQSDGLGGVLPDNPILMSTDGGLTFTVAATLSDPNASLIDQESLAVGPGPGGVGEALWIVGADFKNSGALPEIAAALPILGKGQVGQLSPPVFLPGSDGANFNSIAIGPKGQVAVLYQDDIFDAPGRLLVSVNPTGDPLGAFSQPTVVAQLQTAGFNGTAKGGPGDLPAQSVRGITMKGGIAYDLSNGPHHGRLYVIYTNTATTDNPDTNIFLTSSDNDGTSFPAATQVNDDKTSNSQFWPRVAVDPTSGAVAASWYDARNDNGLGGTQDRDGVPNTDVEFFGAVSFNGGACFEPNIQLEPFPSSAAVNFQAFGDANDYGDYTSLVFEGGVFHPFWADNSDSIAGQNPDPQTLDVATVAVQVPTIVSTSDVYEPNETSDRARRIGPLNGGQSELLMGLTIQNHLNGLPDYDWFRWSAGKAGVMSVNFSTSSTQNGPLEIHVFTLNANNALVELASTNSTGRTFCSGGTTISMNVHQDEPILIEVKGTNVGRGVFGTGVYNLGLALK